MKDFSKIETNSNASFHYNEYNELHRLNGAAIEYIFGDKIYYINNMSYMDFYKKTNIFNIYVNILIIPIQFMEFIKQNFQSIIIEFNPKIKLCYFKKEQINQLPNFIKDFIIL